MQQEKFQTIKSEDKSEKIELLKDLIGLGVPKFFLDENPDLLNCLITPLTEEENFKYYGVLLTKTVLYPTVLPKVLD